MKPNVYLFVHATVLYPSEVIPGEIVMLPVLLTDEGRRRLERSPEPMDTLCLLTRQILNLEPGVLLQGAILIGYTLKVDEQTSIEAEASHLAALLQEMGIQSHTVEGNFSRQLPVFEGMTH